MYSIYARKPLAEGLYASCARIFHFVSQKSAVCTARHSVALTLSCGMFACVRRKQKMWENTEQRICINFCLKLGKTGTETYEMMKTAFGDEAMSRARVFEWFRRFKEGRQSVNSGPRSGRLSTSHNEEKFAQVKAVVPSDRRLTVREIAQKCDISVGSCDEILRKDLNMRRVSSKLVPCLFTEDQQLQRLAIAFDLFQSASYDPECMKLIITGD